MRGEYALTKCGACGHVGNDHQVGLCNRCALENYGNEEFDYHHNFVPPHAHQLALLW